MVWCIKSGAAVVRGGLLAALAVLVVGCAGPGVRPADTAILNRASDPRVQACLALFSRFDRVAAAAGVSDASASPIEGFPYLRVTRFLASFRNRPMNREQFRWWRAALADLDESSRAVELGSLSAAELDRIAPGAKASALREQIDDCRATLQAHDSQHRDYEARLRERAIRPPAYSWAQRVIGLYPLTSLAVLRGSRSLREESARTFALEPSALPASGARMYYRIELPEAPLGGEDIAAILARSADNPWHIPLPTGSDRMRLFAHFAPVWAIDTVDANDRFGTPHWTSENSLAVDVTEPAVYQRVSHVHVRGRILLQLVYSIWFPARPQAGSFDLLGGELDGITWRVTLSEHGRPILYDAMHNCGCYHMVFPDRELEPREPGDKFEEPLWIPQRAPEAHGEGRVLVYVAARTHYIQRLTVEQTPQDSLGYSLSESDLLRVLPTARGQRSMFGPDGIVAGTERLERFLLWPMGIASPGAMRQWGMHATAFVGQRHFDDPDLLERYFIFEGM